MCQPSLAGTKVAQGTSMPHGWCSHFGANAVERMQVASVGLMVLIELCRQSCLGFLLMEFMFHRWKAWYARTATAVTECGMGPPEQMVGNCVRTIYAPFLASTCPLGPTWTSTVQSIDTDSSRPTEEHGTAKCHCIAQASWGQDWAINQLIFLGDWDEKHIWSASVRVRRIYLRIVWVSQN